MVTPVTHLSTNFYCRLPALDLAHIASALFGLQKEKGLAAVPLNPGSGGTIFALHRLSI